MDDFSDIMNLPHHVSKKRRQMSVEERAVQFAAFAALTGYDEDIDETARLTSARKAMTEDEIAGLNAAFQRLLDTAEEQPTVTVTYFLPDERKAGGSYIQYTGTFRFYDAERKQLCFVDRTEIPIKAVTNIWFLKEED